MLISDIDGTILNSDRKVDEKTVETVNKMRADGYKFAIATGRVYSAAIWPYMDMGIEGPIIACNGAIVKDSRTGEILYSNPMAPETSGKVIDILRKHGLQYHIYGEDMVHTETGNALIKKYNAMIGKLPDHYKFEIEFMDDAKDLLERGTKIYKFGIYMDDMNEHAALVEELKGLEGISSYSSLKNSLDIMNEGVDKSSGIAALADIYGIERSEIIAVGDNENDMGMIQWAGLGAAMGNAEETVKAVADVITNTNDDYGVVKLIEDYMYR